MVHSIDTIAVDPTTGSVYTNTFWEEGGMQISQYRNGAKIKHMSNTAGFGYAGSSAVAVNSNYVFGGVVRGGSDACGSSAGNSNANGLLANRICGTSWIGVMRYQNTLDPVSNPASFPTGYDMNGNYYILNNVDDATSTTCTLSGMVATETELYISDYYNDQIQVLDAETMTFLRQFPVPNPGKITLDKNGNLWVLSLVTDPNNDTVGDFKYTYTDTDKILSYTPTGSKLPQELFGPEITNASNVLNL